MNDASRSQSRVIVDLLGSTNGGPVSVELIKAVLWSGWIPAPPRATRAVHNLIRTARHSLGVRIEQVKYAQFVGYRLGA